MNGSRPAIIPMTLRYASGLYLLVLSSGCAEGDKTKHLPRIDIYLRTAAGLPSPTPAGRLELGPKDDGDRLVVSAMGGRVLVTLPKAKEAPRNRSPGREGGGADSGQDHPAGCGNALRLGFQGRRLDDHAHDARVGGSGRRPFRVQARLGSPDPWEGYLLYTLPDESAVELGPIIAPVYAGTIPRLWPAQSGRQPAQRPGVLHDRELAAIAAKPGTVHLVSIRSRIEGNQGNHPDRIASTRAATGQSH